MHGQDLDQERQQFSFRHPQLKCLSPDALDVSKLAEKLMAERFVKFIREGEGKLQEFVVFLSHTSKALEKVKPSPVFEELHRNIALACSSLRGVCPGGTLDVEAVRKLQNEGQANSLHGIVRSSMANSQYWQAWIWGGCWDSDSAVEPVACGRFLYISTQLNYSIANPQSFFLITWLRYIPTTLNIKRQALGRRRFKKK